MINSFLLRFDDGHSDLCRVNPPVYGLDSVFDKKGVGFGEMPAAEKSIVSREGAWMGSRQHQVLRSSDALPFCLGIAAPEQEHHGLFPFVQLVNNGIGELFPAFSPMRVGSTCPHR